MREARPRVPLELENSNEEGKQQAICWEGGPKQNDKSPILFCIVFKDAQNPFFVRLVEIALFTCEMTTLFAVSGVPIEFVPNSVLDEFVPNSVPNEF